MSEQFITKLVEIRKEKKVKQQDLAKQIGVNGTHFCQIEKHKVIPSIEIVLKWIEALGHDIILARK